MEKADAKLLWDAIIKMSQSSIQAINAGHSIYAAGDCIFSLAECNRIVGEAVAELGQDLNDLVNLFAKLTGWRPESSLEGAEPVWVLTECS